MVVLADRDCDHHFIFGLHSHTHTNNIIPVGVGYGHELEHELVEKMLIRTIAGNNEKRRKTVVPLRSCVSESGENWR